MPRGTLRYNAKKEKIYIILFTIVILILARGVWVLYVKNQVAVNEKAAVEERLAQAKGRLEELSYEVATLETERGIEETIRTKFNVAKPGEKIVVLVSSATSTTSFEGESLWSKIHSFFLNN